MEMPYILLVHAILIIWILIDGHKRKVNVIPWAIGTIILGPIILPQYITKRPLKANESRGDAKRQDIFTSFAIIWAVLLVVISIWGGKTITNTIKSEPLEYRLAVMNAGGYVHEYDKSVTHFNSLLDQLSQSCIEDRQQIANISVIMCNKVRARGIDESLLNIMEGLSQLLWPQDSKKRRYSEYAFAYAGLRNTGLSHKDSIDELQAIISGY